MAERSFTDPIEEVEKQPTIPRYEGVTKGETNMARITSALAIASIILSVIAIVLATT
jgi:hypothetical protein